MSVVYVDFLFLAVSRDPQARRVGQLNGHRWCHLWSDDVEALHAVAKRIGMKRQWFHDRPGFPHYDLTPGKRKLAVQIEGVVERHLLNWKREKIKAEESERLNHMTQFVNTELNPLRASAGLDSVDPKKLLAVLQQAELEFFLGGAT